MKLKNKKTGEIRNAVDIDMYTDSVYLKVSNGEFDNETIEYRSLAELNEEWQDVPEEPKEYWAIDCFSPDGELVSQFGRCSERIIENRKQIGNYFETKEEAEKAVEKLEAWKRLKDSGFRFTGFEETDRGCLGDFTIYCYIKPDYTRPYDDVDDDLDLLFGGEE